MPSQPEILVFAAGILGFWLAVHLLDRVASLEKYGVKVSLVFMKYESRRFKDFLCRISQKRQRAWKVFSNISVALGAGLLIFAVYFLSENLLEFVQPGGGGSPVVPVLPGLTIRVYWLPYFILAFLLAVITHEAAHGIVARVEGVNIKSAGLYLAVVQPGGFVEPDEKALERASTASKMRVLSAGSSMNLLVGLLVFLALSVLFFRVPSGIVVMEVLENGPLEQSGIGRWDVLFAVNGTRIKTGSDIDTFMADVTPGDQLTLSTSRGNFSIKAVSHPSKPERAIVGIASSMLYYLSKIGLGAFWDTQLYTTLNWALLLLVNLAVVNMLPIPLLDGDRFLQYFFQKYAKKNGWLMNLFNGVSMFLLVANMTLTLGSGLVSF